MTKFTTESTIIGSFFVNKKDGKTSIKVGFPDGTVMFLNFKKDSKDSGFVVLGKGGKTYELAETEVKITVDVKAKAGATKKAVSKAEADDDLFG